MSKSKEIWKCRESKGITLIPLVITVILVIILASVAIGSGRQSLENVNLQRFFTELQMIQKRVDVIQAEAKSGNNQYIIYDENNDLFESKNGEEDLGIKINEKTIDSVDASLKEKVKLINSVENPVINTSANTYYLYTPENLKTLGIEAVTQDVLICWEIRDVVSLNGITVNGDTYYRDTSLYTVNSSNDKKDANVELIVTGEGTPIRKVEAKVTVGNAELKSFQVKYKAEGSAEWITANSNYFETANPGIYEVLVTANGIHDETLTQELKPEFKVNVEESVDETLTIAQPKWNFTVETVFGQYKYKTLYYRYRAINQEQWNNIAEGEKKFEITGFDNKKMYEIQVADKNWSENVEQDPIDTLYKYVREDEYISDGLILLLDGQNNDGTGKNNKALASWRNLALQNSKLEFRNKQTQVISDFNSSNMTWDDNSLTMNDIYATIELPELYENGNGTFEIALDTDTANTSNWTMGKFIGGTPGAGSAILLKNKGDDTANITCSSFLSGDTTPTEVNLQNVNINTKQMLRIATTVKAKDNNTTLKLYVREESNILHTNETQVANKEIIYQDSDDNNKDDQYVYLGNIWNTITGKIYCIRAYNRSLTQEEIKHNQQVDELRFKDIEEE